MATQTQDHRDYGFVIGLMAGTFIGAGLMIWLNPRVGSELRERVAGSAKELSQRASERYQEVTTRVDEAVDELAKKGKRVRNDVADAVARGAHEVERRAMAVKADGGVNASKPE
jgi:gas vesicle protein